mmetsp:Transcript_82002/g.123134  ORF Transcript_82002/g.123134 Transcript_82002/m.123134 type:complete len:254 (+) Transcript_82002:639-1400(+)
MTSSRNGSAHDRLVSGNGGIVSHIEHSHAFKSDSTATANSLGRPTAELRVRLGHVVRELDISKVAAVKGVDVNCASSTKSSVVDETAVADLDSAAVVDRDRTTISCSILHPLAMINEQMGTHCNEDGTAHCLVRVLDDDGDVRGIGRSRRFPWSRRCLKCGSGSAARTENDFIRDGGCGGTENDLIRDGLIDIAMSRSRISRVDRLDYNNPLREVKSNTGIVVVEVRVVEHNSCVLVGTDGSTSTCCRILDEV